MHCVKLHPFKLVGSLLQLHAALSFALSFSVRQPVCRLSFQLYVTCYFGHVITESLYDHIYVYVFLSLCVCVCAVYEFGWEQSVVLLPWQALLSQVGSI